MRTSQRDKRPVAYAFYDGTREIINSDGEFTGENEVIYTTPVKTLMNVSGGRGAADVAMFGFDAKYSRSIVTEDLETPFNTETVFWIEADPDTQPHDYRVVGVARTINQVVIALSEVYVATGNGADDGGGVVSA